MVRKKRFEKRKKELNRIVIIPGIIDRDMHDVPICVNSILQASFNLLVSF